MLFSGKQKLSVLQGIVFFVLFGLGFLLRAQETLSGNFLFLIDQGRDMLAVRDILYGHHLTLLGPYTSLQGVFQGPLWYYLLAIPTALFGGNPWGDVLLMLCLSMSVIIVVFFVMKQLFGVRAAFVALFFIAISPEAIAAATYSWNPHPMWLLVALFIICLYFLSSGKAKFHLFVWPILSLMFHFETALAFFLVLATFLYLFITQKKAFLSKYFLLAAGIALLFFLPQMLFDIRHNFLMSRSLLALFQGHNQGLLVRPHLKSLHV
jgi:4-amino-4-deoxy-L-arabinose transferase-like glycosyltransferase